MGYGSWKSDAWDSYKTSRGYTASSTVHDMYKATTVKKEFEPVGITYRESCDSTEHPNSTPIILALDVTGSMGSVLETISKKLNTLLTEIYDRKPVEDPQVMLMAFGDTTCDRHPLQVTQFESDIRIAEQLNDLYFERGGGGNDGESYILPWYFASRHTKIDSYEKHNKKGILFTMGDEPFLKKISKEDIKKFVGDDIQADLTAEQLLTEVTRQYEVYHLMIKEGSGMRYGNSSDVIRRWTDLLGQRAIEVEDCTKIPEIIVSILEVMSGKDADDIVKSWDGSTGIVVRKAIENLTTIKESSGLVEF
jgi:hypothetical protein